MKKFGIRAIFLWTMVALLTVAAPAWDDVGHKISAYIAWQQMTPAVRERVIAILASAPEDSQLSTFYITFNSRSDEADKREFFMIASTWPDIVRDRKFEIRYRKYNHSNWHYADTFWTTKDGRIEILKAQADGGAALDKIDEFIKLERSNASDAQKAIGIAWILHLGGDLHQPLHTSARVTELEPKGDQGGNLFLLTPAETPRDRRDNLHSFWDSIIVRSQPNVGDACDSTYVDPIARRIMRRYPQSRFASRLAAEDPTTWRDESLEIASTRIFTPDLKRNSAPSTAYRRSALRIAEERLALAGYRLGELLNRTFAAK